MYILIMQYYHFLSGCLVCVAANVLYSDNDVQMTAYDEARAVYEPVKDNETSEEKGQVCLCVCAF